MRYFEHVSADQSAIPQEPSAPAPRTPSPSTGPLYRAALAALLVVTLARSAVFVFWEGAHFDANQAVIGLMAKHLAELRAFPIFMYGQNYQLAVEAWLAAPLFALAGPSVTALKLPLLAINLAIAWLLLRLLTKDGGLAPWAAGLAALFFALPGPGATARLLEASGGTLEPLLYVLLLWALRERPVWLGLALGIGVLHREFTLYGFASLLAIATVRGRLLTRDGLRRLAVVVTVAALPYAVAQAARPFGPVVGPGSSTSDLVGDARDVVEVTDRLCIAPRAVPKGYLDIARVHWPLLFGTAELSVREFDVESDVVQGAPWAGAALALAMLLALVRVAAHVARERRWPAEYDAFAYLVLTAAVSVSSYVLFRCGVIVPVKLRYDLLSILGAAGLAGWFLAVERRRVVTAAWAVLFLAWVGVAARPHAQLLAQYVGNAPIGGKRAVVRALEARGVRYAMSSYAMAYPVTFLSDERIVVASYSRVRILEYQREYFAHLGEAVRIMRAPCAGGTEAMTGVFLCPP